jgi:hypothetical protein
MVMRAPYGYSPVTRRVSADEMESLMAMQADQNRFGIFTIALALPWYLSPIVRDDVPP